jgi:hypothetical protein
MLGFFKYKTQHGGKAKNKFPTPPSTCRSQGWKNVYKPKYSETYTLVKSKKEGGPRCVIKNG